MGLNGAYAPLNFLDKINGSYNFSAALKSRLTSSTLSCFCPCYLFFVTFYSLILNLKSNYDSLFTEFSDLDKNRLDRIISVSVFCLRFPFFCKVQGVCCLSWLMNVLNTSSEATAQRFGRFVTKLRKCF